MKRKKFLRGQSHHLKRIGGTKKKLKWRRPRGRHNKMREEIRGKQARPRIGMKKKLQVANVLRITCMKDLESIKKGQKALIAKMGERKRKIIIAKLKEKNIAVLN